MLKINNLTKRFGGLAAAPSGSMTHELATAGTGAEAEAEAEARAVLPTVKPKLASSEDLLWCLLKGISWYSKVYQGIVR